ncbi:MAG: HAMP domain-containing sensor histidine kinase [Phycisphaerales bacterium]
MGGISLANKCLILFGIAVVFIITAAMMPPWLLVASAVDESQFETSRQIARLYPTTPLIDPKIRWVLQGDDGQGSQSDLAIEYWTTNLWDEAEFDRDFLSRARDIFRGVDLDEDERAPREHFEALWDSGDRVYRFARVVTVGDDNESAGVVYVERRSSVAAGQLLAHRLFLLISGIIAGVLAIGVFYYITRRIILQPVRKLRETAERVAEGELDIRSEIETGDEFEELSEAFNLMLRDLTQQQHQLRAVNKSLDLKITELAEKNVDLYEAARVKGEFLANVSHELRTPLNSIIGFAEILQDIANKEIGTEQIREEQMAKRRRYLENIVTAGRTLLEMINELLAMAKLDAGSVEVHVQPVNIADTCEALLALIKPLADRKQIEVSLELPARDGSGVTNMASESDLPVILSDQQKVQQIVFNFLSNAVKFTPNNGRVTLRVDTVRTPDGRMIRASVLDDGPGIPEDKQAFIFEKFSQLDGTHTREASGTGLGLAIAKEFAALIKGEIQLVSEEGRGAMFSLIVPESIEAGATAA